MYVCRWFFFFEWLFFMQKNNARFRDSKSLINLISLFLFSVIDFMYALYRCWQMLSQLIAMTQKRFAFTFHQTILPSSLNEPFRNKLMDKVVNIDIVTTRYQIYHTHTPRCISTGVRFAHGHIVCRVCLALCVCRWICANKIKWKTRQQLTFSFQYKRKKM